MRRLVVEFLGTFFLLLTIALTSNALAIAAILMAWVYIGLHVSGAHYNPAVTLAVALRSKWEWALVLRYWVAQILGGVAAFGCAYFLSDRLVSVEPSVPFLKAFLVEVLLAFVLALVVLVVAISERYKSSVAGFAIGFTIPALAAVGSPLSGGLFNPAIAVSSQLFGFFKGMPLEGSHLVLYVGGALLGGALAALTYDHLRLEDKR